MVSFLIQYMKHCIFQIKKRHTIISIFKNIEEELQNRIDDFSQDVIVSTNRDVTESTATAFIKDSSLQENREQYCIGKAGRDFGRLFQE